MTTLPDGRYQIDGIRGTGPRTVGSVATDTLPYGKRALKWLNEDMRDDLGARLGLPGLVDDTGAPRYPGGLRDYMLNHERKPGVGMLAGWRGADGTEHGTGAPNPDQLDRYIANGCFWKGEIPEEASYFRNVNQAYRAYGEKMGFLDTPDPVIVQLYSEVLQKFRLAAQGHGAVTPPRPNVAPRRSPTPTSRPSAG